MAPESLLKLLLPNVDRRNTKWPDNPTQWRIFYDKETKARYINRANKYRVKMVAKLHKYAKDKDEEKFTNLAWILSVHSKAFRIWIYEEVGEKKSWLNYSKTETMKNLHAQFQAQIWTGRTKFRFKRIWIPKPDGSLRPLSVPDITSRCVAKWMLALWEIWLGPNHKFPKGMFGGISQRNSAQAWEYLIKKVIPMGYVAEYDIAKCFDSMAWSKVQGVTKTWAPRFIHNYVGQSVQKAKLNIPKEEWEREYEEVKQMTKLTVDDIMGKINLIPKKLEDFLKSSYEGIRTFWEGSKTEMEEFQMRLTKIWEMTEISYKLSKDKKNFDPYTQRNDLGSEMPEFGWEMWTRHNEWHQENMRWEKISGLDKWRSAQEPDSIWSEKYWMIPAREKGTGIPQGWALSPLITNLIMEEVLQGINVPTVTFLDDGIIGFNKDTCLFIWAGLIGALDEYGMALKPSKFKWIKVGGDWVVDRFRFLGIEMTNYGEMRAKTRSGWSKVELRPLQNMAWPFPRSGGKGSGHMSMGQFVQQAFLTTNQVQWLYCDGKIWVEGGTDGVRDGWVPVSLARMWQNAWHAPSTRKWRRENPEAADRMLASMQAYWDREASARKMHRQHKAFWDDHQKWK